LDGSSVGLLWQHDELDPAYISASQSGTLIQLVAILGCIVAKDDQMLVQSTYGRKNSSVTSSIEPRSLVGPQSHVKEVYAVLWIEWDGEGKVAYRKGTGQVDREAWDRYSNKQIVDVVLG
jgi:hypothetical protein